MNTSQNISFAHIDLSGSVPRAELRAALGLSGSEISINTLPTGIAIPFVHTHRENEEVYLIISGRGSFWHDGTVQLVKTGDAIRVAPTVERCLKASDSEPLTYICVQTKKDSTPKVTRDDGVVIQKEVRWG